MFIGPWAGKFNCCTRSSSGYGNLGYKPVVQNADDDEDMAGYKPYADEDEKDEINSDEDTDRNNSMENGGAGYDRDRRHAERIARALDGVEDDDEEDGDDLDFDDDAFNPRQDESLL